MDIKSEPIKVLLIDDDEDNYLLTRKLLSEVKAAKYALDWASSYETGLQVVGRGEHQVCLVDYRLGEHNGVQLIREAREARVNTPMILLTGHGNRNVDVEAMLAGATDYMVKDQSPSALLERTIRYAIELNNERSRAEADLAAYAHKQAIVAEIGRLALTGGELTQLFDEAVSIVARTLGVDYGTILELRPSGDTFLLRAGVGWKNDHPGQPTLVSAGNDSHAGFTLLSDEPVIVEDLRTESRFADLPLLHKHGVVSGMTVIIRGRDRPYGVLGAHTKSSRRFTPDDVNFLRAVANVMAEAIDRKHAEDELKQSEARFRRVVESDMLGIMFWNLSGEITGANDSFLKMVGYTREELASGGMRWTEMTPPEYRELDEKAVRELDALGVCETYEKEYIRKDGSRVPILLGLARLERGTESVVGFVLDITERKQNENALRESDEKFHQLADNITDAFWIRSPDLREVHYISPAFERIWGCSAESLYRNPKQWVDFILPEDRERVLGAFATLTDAAPSISIEYRIARPDGEVRWIHVRGFQVRDAAGEVIRLTGIVSDITERKRAEEAMRESEERFSGAFEHAPIGVALVSPEGRWLKVNRALCELVGYSQAELLTRSFQDITHPEDLEVDLEYVRRMIAGEIRSYQMEKRYIHRQGHLVPALLNVSLVSDGEGRPRYFISQIQDITEHKRAETDRAGLVLELESEKARLVDIFTNAPAFIASLRGPDHIFELANTHYCDLVGQRDLIGKKAREILPVAEGQSFLEPLDNVYLTGIPFVGVEMPVAIAVPLGAPGETRYVNFIYQPLKDADGAVSIIICHGVDVTEQVLSRGKLQETESQLRQSQKLESVGMLAGGIAHDFNNLLTVITGYSELTLMRLDKADPLTANIEEIKRAAERAASLTRQLLAFSRKQVLQPKVLNLNSVIANVEKMVGRLVGEDMELRTSPGVGLGQVKADPGQIEQVILNLVVNARDAMPKGGKITIETANIYLDQAYARRHIAVQPGWYAMLAVSDTGHGMDAKTQKSIFEPFFTTKELGKGTGLGLSTVYGIVKQSGGSIWVYSEVSVGTTFKIYLPLVDDQTTAPGPNAARPESAAGTETILLAEDEEMVRHLARESLKMYGFTVLEAANASEALLISQQHDGPIHLLLTDVVMPRMSGKELAEQLVSLRPDTRVLYMSGYTDQAIVHHGILDGDISFIGKPFTPDALVLKVVEVLHQNPASTESLERIGSRT